MHGFKGWTVRTGPERTKARPQSNPARAPPASPSPNSSPTGPHGFAALLGSKMLRSNVGNQTSVVDSPSCRSSSTRDLPQGSSPVCRTHAEGEAVKELEQEEELDQDPPGEDPPSLRSRSQSCRSSSTRKTPSPQATQMTLAWGCTFSKSSGFVFCLPCTGRR